EAVRTFNAGVARFNSGDYQQARAILANLKINHLDPNRQAKVREMAASKEMGGVALAADGNLESVEVPTVRQVGGGTGSKGTSPKSLDSVPGAGKITVTDKGQGDDDFQGDLSKVAAAMLNIRFQAMTDESLKVQREAGERFRTGDTEGAMTLL